MPNVILPFPHPGQQIIRAQARRFNWLAAGRRWRKTTLMMTIMVEAALNRGEYLWTAPTYDQTMTAFEETRRAAGDVAKFNISRMHCDFPQGGRILFRSLDNPNVRSKTANGVVIDEAGFVKASAWHELLRPMLVDTGGWLWAGGTPNGRNWFWQEWVRAKDDDTSMHWQAPTLGVKITANGLERAPHELENPNISFDEIQNLYNGMPERIFRQEVLAEFIDDGGGVFRGVAGVSTGQVQEPEPGAQYVMGIDWAFSNDYTVVSVMRIDGTQVYIDRYNNVDYSMQRERIAALCQRYPPAVVISENNAMGQPNNEELVARGIPVQMFTTTSASKAAIIQALAGAIERQQVTLLDDPVQIGELQAYEGKRGLGGLVKYSAPDGMHDDTVMALALAYSGISKGGMFA